MRADIRAVHRERMAADSQGHTLNATTTHIVFLDRATLPPEIDLHPFSFPHELTIFDLFVSFCRMGCFLDGFVTKLIKITLCKNMICD